MISNFCSLCLSKKWNHKKYKDNKKFYNKCSKIIKKRISFSRISEQKFQSAYIDTRKNQNIKNKIPKRKNSMSGVGVMTQIESESSIANRKFNASNTEDKLPNYESEKLNDLTFGKFFLGGN